jgi:hypothetical protein
MIVFDLQCSREHRFEGWFDNSEAFECQLEQGQVTCPYCEDTHIEKILSPVAVKRATSPPQERESTFQTWLRLCRYVQDNFEDVGHNFAQEALKLHCGQAEERNIRGVTTENEEDMLEKEGVQFVKIPMPQQLDS